MIQVISRNDKISVSKSEKLYDTSSLVSTNGLESYCYFYIIVEWYDYSPKQIELLFGQKNKMYLKDWSK